MELNGNLRERIMIARTDLYPEFLGEAGERNPPLFRKGDKLKIWVEISDEWMRVKAFQADQNREQAEGKTIIYLFERDYVDQGDPVKYLISRILEIMQPADGAPLQTEGSSGR